MLYTDNNSSNKPNFKGLTPSTLYSQWLPTLPDSP